MNTSKALLGRSLKNTGLVATGFLAAVGALSLTHGNPVQAQSPGTTLASLLARLNADEATIATLTAKTQYMHADTTAKSTTFSGCNVFVNDGSGKTNVVATNAAGDGLGNLIIGYNETGHFSDTSGDTDVRTGSHNLIVGKFQNYSGYGGLVAGYNNEIDDNYSSVTGGYGNTAHALGAVVGGGNGNKTSTQFAFVPTLAGPQGPKGDTGSQGLAGPAGAGFTSDKIAILNAMSLSRDPNAGGTNTLLTFTGVNVQIVNGLGATNGEPNSPNDTDNPVVNGLGNLIVGYDEASTRYATARGGSHNIIVGTGNNYSSIGGLVAGTTNAVGAPFASVTGGQNNLANGVAASVSGGNLNLAGGIDAAILGGFQNKAEGIQASVSGGKLNIAGGDYSSVTAGDTNVADGFESSITGGHGSTASGDYSTVSGGFKNTASGESSAISGGSTGTASGKTAAISGGLERYQDHNDGWTGGHYATDGP